MSELVMVGSVLFSSLCVALAQGSAEFPLGVASGDACQDRAIVWTAVARPGDVRVDVARDDAFATVVASAVLSADPATGLTLKRDVSGLEPGARYYYRFVRLDDAAVSPVGTFVTAPRDDDDRSFRFVYSGDSEATYQPFRILDFAADEAPDLWFWAGDTIYGDWVSDAIGVATDLEGYRAKYHENRGDAGVRRLSSSAALWAQWDDHEIVNDYDGGDPEPDLTRARIEAGYQAFFENMPVRPLGAIGDPFRLYRSFRYGRWAEFFVLDCRQYRSADAARGALLFNPDPYGFVLPTFDLLTIGRLRDRGRTMLGREQLDWLKTGLRNSSATWKFVLSSVTFTSLLVLPEDRWDGYDAERYELLRFIDRERISGVVLLSADIHANVYNPDVTCFLRKSLLQPFTPGFRVPEFVAGPIATATNQQEVVDFGGSALSAVLGPAGATPLVELAYGSLLLQVACRNGLAFVEPNRFAYLVVEVGPHGARFTHRGIKADPAAVNPPLETLHTVVLHDGARGGCGIGLWPLVALPVGALLARRVRG